MVNVIDRQEELKVLLVGLAAIFCAAVSHDPQHPVIEQISGSDGRFGSVKLGMRHLAVCVHISLPIDPPDALERADIEGVL